MPMINITYNPSMNDSIRDLRYRYKEIKYTHISTHLISGKTIGKNSIRHRQYTCPRYTDANHRKDHHSCVIQQIERNQPCPS